MKQATIRIKDLPKNAFGKENEYRKEEKFCDFTLKAGNISIKVHKVIIASTCRYFEELMNVNPELSELLLRDISEEALQQIVDCMYTGEVHCDVREMKNVFILFDRFKVDSVVDKCVDILCKSINSTNCIDFYRLGEKFCQEKLVKTSLTCMIENSTDLLSAQNFVALTLQEVESLISDDRLRCSEDLIFTSVIEWIEHDKKNRMKFFPQLEKYIRFGLINRNFLVENVCKINILLDNNNCLRTILHSFAQKDMDFKLSKISKPRSGFCSEKIFVCSENKFCVYSPAENKYVNCVGPLLERKYYGHVNFENNFLVTGGEIDGASSTAACEYYNPIVKQWRQIPSMSRPRSHHGTAYLNNFIYCCGGTNDKSVEICDVQQGKWTTGPEMLAAHSDFGIVAEGYCIYAFGGNNTQVVERLDTREGKWSKLTDGFNSYNRAIKVGNSIYCMSGTTGKEFHIQRNSWEDIASVQKTAFDFELVALDKNIFRIGGKCPSTKCCHYGRFQCMNCRRVPSNIVDKCENNIYYYNIPARNWTDTGKPIFQGFTSAVTLCTLPE